MTRFSVSGDGKQSSLLYISQYSELQGTERNMPKKEQLNEML